MYIVQKDEYKSSIKNASIRIYIYKSSIKHASIRMCVYVYIYIILAHRKRSTCGDTCRRRLQAYSSQVLHVFRSHVFSWRSYMQEFLNHIPSIARILITSIARMHVFTSRVLHVFSWQPCVQALLACKHSLCSSMCV